jgi:choline transporter-like protein 2/4/5
MFVPIVIFFLMLGFIAYWLIFSALIYSTSAPDEKGVTPYVKLEWNASTGWQLLVYGFGLLWNVCFALSLC